MKENRSDLNGGSWFDCELASLDKALCSPTSPGAGALPARCDPDLLPRVPEPGSRWKATGTCLTP